MKFGLNLLNIKIFLHAFELTAKYLSVINISSHMERTNQQKSLTKLFRKATDRLFDKRQIDLLVKDVEKIPNEEVQEMERREQMGRQKMEEERKIQRIVEKEKHQNEGSAEKTSPREEKSIERQGRQVIEKQNKQNPASQADISGYSDNQLGLKSQRDVQPLSFPPALENRHKTESSVEKNKGVPNQNSVDSQKGKRLSSQEDSINLQFTLKTRNSKNLSMNQGRVDSLIYSDATLQYSNATGFGHEVSPHSSHPQRVNSHKSMLKQISDGQEGDISARMQRAVSRQYDRQRTQSQALSEQQQAVLKKNDKTNKHSKQQPDGQLIFKTQISEEKINIYKIKEIKENKKKKLESQLQKINRELEELTKKEATIAGNSGSRVNTFESRVKISDNANARAKAQKLVRDLRYEKKSRMDGKLNELEVIDKNINQYMQQLMRERYLNEERIKQRKKLQIIERMKIQEMRKIEDQQQKNKNLQFVHKLRQSDSTNHINNKKSPSVNKNSKLDPILNPAVPTKEVARSKQRSPTKKSEAFEQSEISPQLSRKKAYLRRVRNLSYNKDKKDVYEQVLM